MPMVGNKKFPYTPSGIARANAIKKQLMGGSMKQDKMYRPNRDGKKNPLPMPRPGMDPGFARRPRPPARPGMRPTPPFGKRPGGGRVQVGGGRRPMVPPRGPNKNKAWGRNPRPRKPKMIRYL